MVGLLQNNVSLQLVVGHGACRRPKTETFPTYFAFAIFLASNAFTPSPAAPVVSWPGTIWAFSASQSLVQSAWAEKGNQSEMLGDVRFD